MCRIAKVTYAMPEVENCILFCLRRITNDNFKENYTDL